MGELSSLSGASPPGTINRTWLSRRLKPPAFGRPRHPIHSTTLLRLFFSVLFNITQENTGPGERTREGRSAAKMSRVMKSTALLFICFLTASPFPASLFPSLSFFEFFPFLRAYPLSPLFRGRTSSPLAPAPLKNQLRETILGTRSEPTN